MAANNGFSIAQAMIRNRVPPHKYAQSQADIKTPNVRGFGQSLTSMVKFAKQTSFSQAQVKISNPYHLAQAQAEVVQG